MSDFYSKVVINYYRKRRFKLTPKDKPRETQGSTK